MNEQELIQKLRERDENAFYFLVEKYRNKVFNTAINILQDASDAEDSAQEVFIQVYESVNSFKQQSSLSTWIYTITVRKALDKLRRRKTRQRLHNLLPWWMPQEKESLKENNFHHPGISIENKQKAGVLFKAIAALPEKQRVAFTLIKVEGVAYKEVCEIMQQNIKAVESLVSRAKQNLQKQLEKFYKE